MCVGRAGFSWPYACSPQKSALRSPVSPPYPATLSGRRIRVGAVAATPAARMDVVADVATGAFATGGPPCSTVWAMPDDDTMLKQISSVLHQLCEHNKSHLGAACPTLFDSDAPPLLLPSVHCYLVRIHVNPNPNPHLHPDPNPDPNH